MPATGASRTSISSRCCPASSIHGRGTRSATRWRAWTSSAPAIALYACPDDLGLATIEKIILGEGLPHITYRTANGSATRPRAGRTFIGTARWTRQSNTPRRLGFKDISRDTGEFYPSLRKQLGRAEWGSSNGKSMTYKEFAEECHKHGLTHGGLHTLCVFLQGGISHDVTPVPSEHLQTVCRTKLAKDISATDTEIVVTDPSFLAEKRNVAAGATAPTTSASAGK